MAVHEFEVFVVEHGEMKRPAGAPDQLFGGPWFTPEVLRVQVEADTIADARWLAAGMGHCTSAVRGPVRGRRDWSDLTPERIQPTAAFLTSWR